MTPAANTTRSEDRTDSRCAPAAPLRTVDGAEFPRNEHPDTCKSCDERVFPGDGYLLGQRAWAWNVVCDPPVAVSI